jgi:hypothetical protein
VNIIGDYTTCRRQTRETIRVLSVALLSHAPTLLLAQPSARPVPLATVERISDAPFNRVIAVRERSDHSVVVADATDRALYIVKDGVRIIIGRQGSGPGEYRTPSRLFPLAGDTTLVIDGTDRRWHLLAANRLWPIGTERGELATAIGAELDGTNAHGGMLSVLGHGKLKPGERFRYMRSPRAADTLVAVLSTRRPFADTIARMRGQYLGQTTVTKVVDGRSENYGLLNPLQTHDQAVMFPDGTIAIAHFDPYRVDWRSPSGQWKRGAPMDEASIPVTASIKQRSALNGQRDVNGKPLFAPGDFPPYPARVPPFLFNATFALADGRLAVLRTRMDPSDTQQIDVFDQTGRRTQVVALPSGIRVLAGGMTGLIGTIRNADDEEMLVRVRIPST